MFYNTINKKCQFIQAIIFRLIDNENLKLQPLDTVEYELYILQQT